MAAQPYYGNAFPDEISALTVHSSNDNVKYICQWMGEFGSCNHEFSVKDLSAHFRDFHNVHGSDDLPVQCLWNGCNKVVKKESFGRHTKSKHLIIRHYCTTCFQGFTRLYGLRQHLLKCSSLQQ